MWPIGAILVIIGDKTEWPGRWSIWLHNDVKSEQIETNGEYEENKVNGLGTCLVFKVRRVGNKDNKILQSYYQYVSSKQSNP
jgi:hypothetical protein